jgi:hypothetical protein
MERVKISLLFICVLLMVAGCSSADTSGGSTEGMTLTPAPVPTGTPGPPPGVTDDRVNLSALAAAHNATLRNVSFTKRTTTTIRLANGTRLARYTLLYRVGSGGNYSSVYNLSESREQREPTTGPFIDTIHRERWANETFGVKMRTTVKVGPERSYSDTQSDYHTLSRDGIASLRRRPVSTNTIRRAFGNTEPQVVGEVKQDGKRLYRVEATALRKPAFPVDDAYDDESWTLKDPSQWALVDSSGIMRSRSLRYTPSISNGSYRIEYTVQYTDIGSTTVDRPSWFSKVTPEPSQSLPHRSA